MPIGYIAQPNLYGRHRDLKKHFARWIGLLLGSILLIGMAAGEEDSFFSQSPRHKSKR